MPANNIPSQIRPRRQTKFWPLFLIVIITLILAGLIYLVSYNSQLQDEANSLYFWKHAANAQVSK